MDNLALLAVLCLGLALSFAGALLLGSLCLRGLFAMTAGPAHYNDQGEAKAGHRVRGMQSGAGANSGRPGTD